MQGFTGLPEAERAGLMVQIYGEVCRMTEAARILSKSPQTIRMMMDDGRLQSACEGKMVDVRSIAHYICAPVQNDRSARLQRKRKARGIECQWEA